jgi:hypothetical protein
VNDKVRPYRETVLAQSLLIFLLDDRIVRQTDVMEPRPQLREQFPLITAFCLEESWFHDCLH